MAWSDAAREASARARKGGFGRLRAAVDKRRKQQLEGSSVLSLKNINQLKRIRNRQARRIESKVKSLRAKATGTYAGHPSDRRAHRANLRLRKLQSSKSGSMAGVNWHINRGGR